MRFTTTTTISFLILSVAHAQDETRDGVDGAEFCIEKGFKCHGGFEIGKGGTKTCEGGMRQEFSLGASYEDVAQALVDDLSAKDCLVVPDKHDVLGEFEELAGFLDVMDPEDEEEGFEKTIEFGGKAHMEWGCKVTYAKKDGKFSKKTECGVKAEGKMGKKPDDLVLNIL